MTLPEVSGFAVGIYKEICILDAGSSFLTKNVGTHHVSFS